jgi:hypothetical protein
MDGKPCAGRTVCWLAQVLEHLIASLGFALRVHRTRICHLRAAAAGGRAVALRIGANDFSVLRVQQHFARRNRRWAHGDSLFFQALRALIAGQRRRAHMTPAHSAGTSRGRVLVRSSLRLTRS